MDREQFQSIGLVILAVSQILGAIILHEMCRRGKK